MYDISNKFQDYFPRDRETNKKLHLRIISSQSLTETYKNQTRYFFSVTESENRSLAGPSRLLYHKTFTECFFVIHHFLINCDLCATRTKIIWLLRTRWKYDQSSVLCNFRLAVWRNAITYSVQVRYIKLTFDTQSLYCYLVLKIRQINKQRSVLTYLSIDLSTEVKCWCNLVNLYLQLAESAKNLVSNYYYQK